MKKNFKRVLSAALVIVMLFTGFPGGVRVRLERDGLYDNQPL